MRLKFLMIKAVEKMAARNARLEFRLMDLPNELIAHIIEHVDSIKALRKLSRTCRRIQDLTEPVLYRHLLLRRGPEVDKIITAVSARSARAAAIRYLDLPCDGDHQNFPAISALLGAALSIKEVMFESPRCNENDFEDEEEWTEMTDELFAPFQQAACPTNISDLSKLPLQKLQRLTLHMNGVQSPYWTLDQRSVNIFLLPSLKYLKMSCVNILDDVLEHAQKPLDTETPLTHLELEECNITHGGLHAILRLPSALQELYLGENCHNIRHFADDVEAAANHLFQRVPGKATEAIAQQKGTLKKLTYVTTPTYHQHYQLMRFAKPNDFVEGGFADFRALEDVTLIGQCPEFERSIMTSRSPPNLRTLTYQGMSPFRRESSAIPRPGNALQSIPFLRAPSCSLPKSLTDLRVSYFDSMTSLLRSGRINDVSRSVISKAANAVNNTDIKLSVSLVDRSHFFPPYLYGEPTPSETLIFADGAFVGRFAPTPGAWNDEEYDDGDSEWESDDE